jgi:hypothetical protein
MDEGRGGTAASGFTNALCSLVVLQALASSDMTNQQKGEEQGALSVMPSVSNMIADPRNPSMPRDVGAHRLHVRLSGRGTYAWLKKNPNIVAALDGSTHISHGVGPASSGPNWDGPVSLIQSYLNNPSQGLLLETRRVKVVTGPQP